MKILHLLSQLPARTGSGVYFSSLVEGLAPFGHQQRAIFASQGDFCWDGLASEQQYPLHFQSAALPFPIVGMNDVMPYPSSRYADLSPAELAAWQTAFRQIMQQAGADFSPEVVFLHHLWISTALAVEAFPAAKKIGICHNTDIRQAEQHPGLHAQYVTNLDQLDLVFALSEMQKERIHSLFGITRDKIVVLGGGYNGKRFFPAREKLLHPGVELYFAAKIERSKGVFELVRAFRKLSAQKENLHLDIIGTPDHENAQLLAAEIGSAENISLVPISDQQELAEYIRSKDIFVMPSYFEGLGLMAVESLASGVWTVATEIEGLIAQLGPSINASGAIEYVKLPRLYDTDKPLAEDVPAFVDALAEKLLLQIERVEQGMTFPEQVWPQLHKYSWQSIVGRVDELIKNV